MNKQTAVHFLIEKIDFDANVRCFSKDEWKEIFDQANQMEKEQQKYFFDCGRQYQLNGEGTFKQVYNETYGGQYE